MPLSDSPTYQTTRLGTGRHDRPGAVVCVMELASMLAGERFSDHPASVCPTIGAILRAYNDAIDERRRTDLYRYAAESVYTRGSFEDQLRRARATIDFAQGRIRSGRRISTTFRKPAGAPRPDDGPEQVASYLVASLGRPGRWSDAIHAEVLSLLDELIAMGAERRVPAAIEPPLDVLELLEVDAELVEHGGGAPQLVLAEVG
jgi:hypothetical protein